MTSFDAPMSARQFGEALEDLRLSVYASATVLGMSLRQAQRYSSGEQIVAGPTVRLLRTLQYHVSGLRAEKRRLKKQIEALASGKGTISHNHVDVTAETVRELRRQLGVIDGLLTSHPSGLKNLA